MRKFLLLLFTVLKCCSPAPAQNTYIDQNLRELSGLAIMIYQHIFIEDYPCPNDKYLSVLIEPVDHLIIPKPMNPDTELIVSPNPASDFITIESEGIARLFSIKGEYIKSSYKNMDISTVPIGIYIIRSAGKTARLIISR